MVYAAVVTVMLISFITFMLVNIFVIKEDLVSKYMARWLNFVIRHMGGPDKALGPRSVKHGMMQVTLYIIVVLIIEILVRRYL